MVDVGPKAASDANAVVVGLCEGVAQSSKQASGSRDGRVHEVELSKRALPSLAADSRARGEIRKDPGELLFPVRGKLQGLAESVDDPT